MEFLLIIEKDLSFRIYYFLFIIKGEIGSKLFSIWDMFHLAFYWEFANMFAFT